jgi:hypothetical protein
MPESHAPAAPAPQPVAPRKPCSGPRCSQAPAVPPLAPPTVAPPAPHEWGCLSAAPAAASDGFRAPLLESSPQHPVRIPSRIFHPPRHMA